MMPALMFSRALILAALLLWSGIGTALLIRGSSANPSPAVQPVSAELAEAEAGLDKQNSIAGLPFRSVTIQLQRVDWMDRYEKSVDEIAALGADTVMFVVDPRQENSGSRQIYLDMRITPTPDKLERLIRHAKSKNLRVILMPIVLLDKPRKDTEWRGTIAPDPGAIEGVEPWDLWFKAYTDMITHYAWIAQGTGVDLLVVGSELVSTEVHTDKWVKVIAAVRKIYKGKLTYSSNWDHYTAIKFWDKLDLIGMNSYWSLDEGKKDKASVDDMKKAWKDIQKSVLGFAADHGKPVVLLEAGWCSISNAADEPWNYPDTSTSVDYDLQKRLYEGFFESWYGNPQLGGFSIWEWSASPDPSDGDRDAILEATKRAYTPEGKPAEAVLKEYFAKGPWPVNPKIKH